MKKKLLLALAALLIAALPVGVRMDGWTLRQGMLVPAYKYACAFPLASGNYPCGAVVTGGGGGGTYTFTGPNTLAYNAASSNYTVSGNPSSSTTITPADATHHGTFTPSTVSLSATVNSANFTYTPIVTGTFNLSTTNSGTLTNPAAISVTIGNLNTSWYPTIPCSWTNSGENCATGASDPFGGTAASTWTENTSNAYHLFESPSNITITANKIYTLGIMVKAVSGSRQLEFGLEDAGSIDNASVLIQPGACTAKAGNWGSSTVSNIKTSSPAAGWCLVTASVSINSTSVLLKAYSENSSNSASYAGDGTSAFAVYGPVLN